MRQFVLANMDAPRQALQNQCEQAIRNYDPCISCATHFLKLEIQHEQTPQESEVESAGNFAN